jgi:hypothetical protein
MIRETDVRAPDWQLIEHPHATARLAIAEQADRCAKWLKAQGLEVLRVEKGPRTPPRITIRTSPLCERIEGAVHIYERGLQGERRYKTVMRLGCEVRWDEQVAHARHEVSQKLAYQKTRSIFRRILGWTGGAA